MYGTPALSAAFRRVQPSLSATAKAIFLSFSAILISNVVFDRRTLFAAFEESEHCVCFLFIAISKVYLFSGEARKQRTARHAVLTFVVFVLLPAAARDKTKNKATIRTCPHQPRSEKMTSLMSFEPGQVQLLLNAFETIQGQRVRFFKRGKTLKRLEERWLAVGWGTIRCFKAQSGGKVTATYSLSKLYCACILWSNLCC